MVSRFSILKLVALMLLFFSIPFTAQAHCDTMNGPVVKAAQLALSKGDVTPVLRWVQKKDEEEVRKAFLRTMRVRGTNVEARELADMYFFETLVRLHRAGEGEPYTGIRPANTPVEPIIALSDMAIESSDVNALSREIVGGFEKEIQSRFKRLLLTMKDANASVDAGREYVEAYVSFVHYIEQIHQLAEGTSAGHAGERRHQELPQ